MKALWKHQVNAIKLAETNKNLALFFEVGTGKTRTVIEILRRKYAQKNSIRRTLIFAPLIVCQNWKEEFALFSKVNQKDIIVLGGTGYQREKTLLKELGEDLQHNKIIVTNYETVQMKTIYSILQSWQPEILVADECHRLKNPQGLRSKLVVSLADTCENTYVLTGTPILNNPMDIFMQFRVLDAGKTFGTNMFAFRAKYFVDINDKWKGKQSYYPKWVPVKNKYAELQDLISAKALRVLKKDCLDLPPFLRKIVEVELSPEQKRLYTEMKNDFLAFVKSKEGEPKAVVAQLAITKALRMQQIVSGFAKDDTGAVHRLPCPRIESLEQILEDITQTSKVIVWCVFRENYLMIAELCKKLSLEYREIHGDISQQERLQGMDDFRKLDTVRVMIANQSAGGTGINLIEASYSVYYSKNFSLEQDLQSEARNFRGGSEMHESVTRIDLIARGTIDELVTTALSEKQSISDQILGWKL